MEIHKRISNILEINQIQENLVLKIANYDKEIPMFMVGDMKQSIYRFRQADPSSCRDTFNLCFISFPAALVNVSTKN